jgi:hypothetical protein
MDYESSLEEEVTNPRTLEMEKRTQKSWPVSKERCKVITKA